MDLIQADIVLEVAERHLKGTVITDPVMVRTIRHIHETSAALLQQIPPEAP